MKRQSAFLSCWLVLVLAAGSGWTVPGAASAQEEKDKPKSEEKQEEEKKESKKSEPRSRVRSNRQVLSRVLRSFVDGYEGLSPSSMRDYIHREKFYDYPRFEEGVTVFLRSVGEMRVFTREVSVEVKNAHAEMIVEAEMVFASRTDPSREERRRQRIVLDFQRTPEGWKIIEINPRSFFLP